MNTYRRFRMRSRWLTFAVLFGLASLLSTLSGNATGTYQNTSTLHLSSSLNQLTSFDISYVDPKSSTYVLADRNNRVSMSSIPKAMNLSALAILSSPVWARALPARWALGRTRMPAIVQDRMA